MKELLMISTVTTTTMAITPTQALAYGIIAVVALISLLTVKEISSSETNNQHMKSFVKGSNVAIIPLLLVFVSIVAFKVASIL